MAEKKKAAYVLENTHDTGILWVDTDSYTIEMETIEDNFEKAIAKYDYPYADGTDLEDMGQKAHIIKFRCFFYDDVDKKDSPDEGINNYDNHIKLLNSLEKKDLLLFDHPKYGLMKGKIESISVRHDDRERCAELDITFVEQMRGSIKTLDLPAVKSSLEEAYVSGQDAQVKKTKMSLWDKIKNYESKLTELTATVSTYIATAGATVNEITSPINTLQATITYATSLPGIIVGGQASILERVALLYSSLTNFPSRMLSAISDAFNDLISSFETLAAKDNTPDGQEMAEVMISQLTIACAQRLALEAATVYTDDEAAYRDPDSYPDYQVMTIFELEATLALVREWIERAMTEAREIDSLRTMAAALLDHVNQVRLEREKIIQVTIEHPTHLFLILMKYGLSISDADRVLKINKIKHPNFVQGVINIYAR